MPIHLFQYRIPAPVGLDDLNAFLAGNRVARVTQHMVTGPEGGMLVFVVETARAGQAGGQSQGSESAQQKVDYRVQLPPDEYTVFDRLREMRKQVAEAEGVPVYALFSNAQLADMVRHRVTTPEAMAKVSGIGSARVSKYASKFLPIVAEAFGNAERKPQPASNEEPEKPT